MNEPESCARSGPRRRGPSRRCLCLVAVGGVMIRITCLPLSSPEAKPIWDAFWRATSTLTGIPPKDAEGRPADWSLHAWPADHGAYVQWGRQAVRDGLLSLYTRPPEPRMKVRISSGEHWIYEGSGQVANYPPLALVLITLEGHVLAALERMSLPRDAEGRRPEPEFVANTILARCVFQTPGLVFDVLLALGVMRLTRLLSEERSARIAFIVMMLAPPFWIDSCWWGQTESWVLAPGMMMMEELARRRWLRAGVWWGLALGMKTQGLLFAPIWIYIVFEELRRERPTGEAAARREPWTVAGGALMGMAVLNLLALPFWLTSGPAWFMQSIVRNLVEEAPHTTLKAFNFWYVDLLRTLDTSVHQTWVGLSKDTWGKFLLAAGGLAAAWRAARAPVCGATRGVVFAGLWLLAVVQLPTRVHERYLLLCLPFLMAVVFRLRVMRWGVGALWLVATLQVTVHHWLDVPADLWSLKLDADTRLVYREAVRQTPPERRHTLPVTEDEAVTLRFRNFLEARRPYAPWEWAATLLALAATIGVFMGGRAGRGAATVKGSAESLAPR